MFMAFIQEKSFKTNVATIIFGDVEIFGLSNVLEQAGSAGRRKRLLDLRAQGERDEDEKDSGVVLFSDEPDLQSPVQPGKRGC